MRVWQVPDERNRLVLTPSAKPGANRPDPRRDRISQVVFNATGTRIITASTIGRIAIFDTVDGQLLTFFQQQCSFTFRAIQC